MSRPQLTMLVAHLSTYGSISALEAANLYRIRSLSRRINDLEAHGYEFRRERRKDPSGQRYVRYHVA